MCSKQKKAPLMALTARKCVLSTQPHRNACARARLCVCVCETRAELLSKTSAWTCAAALVLAFGLELPEMQPDGVLTVRVANCSCD